MELPITITPGMQREKAAQKRIKNRRGIRRGKSSSGSKPGKASRKRALLRSSSRRGKRFVHEEPEEEPVEAEAEEAEEEEAEVEQACSEEEKGCKAKAGKAKGEKAGRKRARKAKSADAETADDPGESEGHPAQRRVQLGPKSWVYEVLEGQTLGCAGCRFIFMGCKACKKITFRGRGVDFLIHDDSYQKALAALNGEEAEGSADKGAKKTSGKKKRGSPLSS